MSSGYTSFFVRDRPTIHTFFVIEYSPSYLYNILKKTHTHTSFSALVFIYQYESITYVEVKTSDSRKCRKKNHICSRSVRTHTENLDSIAMINLSMTINVHPLLSSFVEENELKWPVPVRFSLRFSLLVQSSNVSSGNEHTAILLETGEVYTCGYNNSGQCGVGRIGRVPSFERVAALADVNVKFLCSSNGCEHLIAVSQSGKAYACGYNGRGQLGLGHTHHEVIPVPLRGKLLNKKVIFVACTYYHSALYVASHEVYTFGRNSHGQLGLSDTVDRLEPERVPTLGSRAISAIACGHYHTCFALTSGGVLSCGKSMSLLFFFCFLHCFAHIQSRCR